MKIKYPICFFASILLFLLTYWSRDYKDTASWTGTACYFVLAYLLLEHYDDGTHTIPIVWCLVLGRLLPTIPPLFGNLHSASFELFTPFLSVAAIVLAATYHRNHNGVVLMLSVIIMILLNTLGPEGWKHVVGY